MWLGPIALATTRRSKSRSQTFSTLNASKCTLSSTLTTWEFCTWECANSKWRAFTSRKLWSSWKFAKRRPRTFKTTSQPSKSQQVCRGASHLRSLKARKLRTNTLATPHRSTQSKSSLTWAFRCIMTATQLTNLKMRSNALRRSPIPWKETLSSGTIWRSQSSKWIGRSRRALSRRVSMTRTFSLRNSDFRPLGPTSLPSAKPRTV